MASLGENRGPYELDGNIVSHRNIRTTTILNYKKFDGVLADLENYYEYEVGYVPEGYENRPDLISNVFYGTPKHWWLLMMVNNITDPFEGFQVNQRIVINRLR